ncbi:MAG: hypothetical protein K8R87_11655 [Verrucomicrobia bacterium]|nr:hypothetical protein [Verrucomicrobiota bacterium]
MKLRIISTSLCFLITGLISASPVSNEPLGTITTSLGRSYQNCRVCQVDPDGVIFAHQRGIAKVLFGEIPEQLRSKLGFDEQKATDYAKDQSEKKRRALELKAEMQKELLKAQTAVSVAEIQSAGMVQQAYAMGGGGSSYLPYTGGLYGWDNSLYNEGYNGNFNNRGQGWNNINCGTPGVSTLRYNPRCGAPLLNVISNNRGGLGPVNCQRPANNFFAVPPVSVAGQGGQGRR